LALAASKTASICADVNEELSCCIFNNTAPSGTFILIILAYFVMSIPVGTRVGAAAAAGGTRVGGAPAPVGGGTTGPGGEAAGGGTGGGVFLAFFAALKAFI
jgi:hypothetical protein